MARVTIDKDTCIGCGACWALAPDFFEQDPDDGKSRIVEKYRVDGNPSVGEVPDDLLEDVRGAVEGCPTGSLKLEE
ncbi:MAG: ferredoxin [Thaumarchaeota archaeon]|nr:ferredoxin [Nitrososphaerota archaeon]